MKALLQRVSRADVSVAGDTVGVIDAGVLVLLGLDAGDDESTARRMVDKILAYRMFADAEGKMNCSVRDVGGGVLLVSQFTLSADTGRGLRPSFSSALSPAPAQALYDYTLDYFRDAYAAVEAGRFGADMQVSLVNDGPVTFLLEVQPD